MKTTNVKFENKTELHQEWLGKIQDFFAEYRYIPSYEYMGVNFRIGSKSTVNKLVNLLKSHGFLDAGPDNKLIPGKRFFEIPFSNASVQAGPFTSSYGQDGELISIQEVLVKKPSITKTMPVRGNSMKDLGILDGDTAVYEKRPLANVRDIVIAIINNDFTIKELGKENNQFILIPHNKDFEIIRPKEHFEIYGVVTATYRTY